MRAFNSDTLTMLGSGRAVSRGLLLFDFSSGLYGFWDGLGVLSHAGVDYIGAGQLLGVDQVSYTGDLSTSPLTIRLTAVPNSDLDPDVLATIEAEQYHQRPVTLSRAYIDPETRSVVSVERVFRGYVDQITHDYTIGGEATIVCSVESRARDNTRRGWRTRSDADQKRIASDDGGMRHAAVSGSQDIYWGKFPGTVKK